MRRKHSRKNCPLARRAQNRRWPSRVRLGEMLERRELLTGTTYTVTSPLDPAVLTAGTIRYAVHQADADAVNGISDHIVFNTAQMGGNTISLQRGPLELTSGSGAITIDGGG